MNFEPVFIGAMHRWLAQANNNEFSAIRSIADRTGISNVDVWGARVLAMSHARGFTAAKDVVLAAQLSALGSHTESASAPRELRFAEVRSLAGELAHRGPAPVARQSEPAAAPASWSDRKIRDRVAALAERHGLTAPGPIALMTDVLLNPSRMNAQRGAALGQSEGIVGNNAITIRRVLQLPRGDLRPSLARQIGMPLTTLVERIGTEQDPQLGRRVISKINASHREGVAELLLLASPGSQIEIHAYESLDKMFTSDPLAADDRCSGMSFLRDTFARERIPMLRVMGFSREQILSMNPVGRELSRRFDPALGTYSAAERAVRHAKGLPNTREEAAQLLMTARAANKRQLSYRSWVALGLVSDKPWSTMQELNAAYLSVAPGGYSEAARSDTNLAFRVAENLRGQQIPRGSAPDLVDRDYRRDINRLLLKSFGLGATAIGTGQLESIPTDFEPRDRPSPTDRAGPPVNPVTQQEGDVESIRWQQLVPLLH
jgi:hypothetical protein